MLEKCVSRYLSTLRRCPRRLNSTTTSPIQRNQKQYEENITLESAEEYLDSKLSLSNFKDRIPPELLKKRKIIDHLYLINPYVAKKIFEQISPYLKKNCNKTIAECNPGLGFLTRQLLRMEEGPIKLFEPSRSFREKLKAFLQKKTGRAQLYSKNLLSLAYYADSDKIDDGKRIQKLLKNVPKKGWTEDPAISIIGPLFHKGFLKHLISSVATQTSLASYGRVEMFAIMKPSHYWALSTEQNSYISRYNNMTVLFNIYFDYKVLSKLPREAFIPWDRSYNKKGQKSTNKLNNIDKNALYLAHINIKKNLPLPLEQLVPLNFFIRTFFRRKAKIIPTLEFCVPNCGVHVILPQLQHTDYFENLNIFTEFRELTPIQILGVFREMYHHPNYVGSPFNEMLESHLMKVESAKLDHILGPEDSFMDEIEEELGLDNRFTEEHLNNS